MKSILESNKLNESTELLRAITHPVRLSILSFIDDNKVNVNKIYSSLNLEQSITSQHLKVLRDCDLVNTERNGKYILYTVNKKNINQIIESVDKLFGIKDEL